ncbi:MAG: 2-oxoglutarate dehydrogenase complex dihydrolipoyllysine-residue succinyltransferase [Rickettsiales bacterium]
MAGEIIVPSLGESVSEATVSKWFKQVGDNVQADEPIVELETDKVTIEVNAPAGGALKSIAVKEEETVEVGAVLGLIDVGVAGKAPSASKSEPAKEDRKAETNAAGNEGGSSKPQSGPAARKIMDEKGLSSSDIAGSGKDGRVTKGDVIEASSGSGSSSNAHKTPDSQEPREERVKMSKLRQVIAKRLKDSQNNAAILTTFNEIDMSNIIAMRKEYKDAFEKKYGVRLGFMSMFVKAAVSALKEIPAVNAEIDGDEIIYKNHYDIGVAVGTAQGLVVPVVRNADQMSLAEIEKEIGALAEKARLGTLSMNDLTGGTFTVSNGGVYGSLMSTPIINPPQSGILGMHKTEERPVAVGGQVVIRPMMYVALSYDHRIIDGKESVTFLVKVKEAIEDPRRLLLGL